MIEVRGNLWDFPADVRVITTNGMVKTNGCCVMGRGCAKEAKDKFLNCDRILGSLIKQKGNHCHVIFAGPILVSFPVKHSWRDTADIQLIERSARELVEMANHYKWEKIVLPRPGCGNGNLSWDFTVKPVIGPILDDRFYVITFEN